MVFFVKNIFDGKAGRRVILHHSSSAAAAVLCRYRVLASFYHSNCTKDG